MLESLKTKKSVPLYLIAILFYACRSKKTSVGPGPPFQYSQQLNYIKIGAFVDSGMYSY